LEGREKLVSAEEEEWAEALSSPTNSATEASSGMIVLLLRCWCCYSGRPALCLCLMTTLMESLCR
jgi:hypothetical protein